MELMEEPRRKYIPLQRPQNYRTFNQYLERDVLLMKRYMKIRCKYILLQQFHPFKAIFLRKKFNRIIALINEAKRSNASKGYYY